MAVEMAPSPDHTRRLQSIGQFVVVLPSPCWACEAEGKTDLNRNTYMTVTGTLFLVVAIVHLLRIILGWPVEVGGLSIPFWTSWLAVLAAGALSYFGFRQK